MNFNFSQLLDLKGDSAPFLKSDSGLRPMLR